MKVVKLLIQVHGVYKKGRVIWKKNDIVKDEPYTNETMQLYYGLAGVGQNLVWKPIDEDPSLFLNFYEKASNFNKTSHIPVRYVIVPSTIYK